MSNLLHKLVGNKKRWNFQKGDLTENTELLQNPARGWYQIYTFLAQDRPALENVVSRDVSGDALALVIINIGAYRDCEAGIDQSALDNIRLILSAFVMKQYDMVLRITYDHEGKALEREPFFFTRVQEHLRQLTPIIKEFSENIFVFQGMLVGNWGEMHTSRFLDGEKLKVLWNILREDVGEDVFCAVRKPAQWRLLHPDNCGKKQMTYDTMGLFDDAIFGSESHLGTFGTDARNNTSWENLWAREDELQFEQQLCAHVPNGGEAILGEQYAGGMDPTGTVDVLKKMHITYLNRYYDERILNLWKEWKWNEAGSWQGKSLYDYIGCHLGYRFWVKDVSVSLTSRKERMFLVNITIENTGFANLYEEAELFFEWGHGKSERYLKKLDCDMRQWNSGTVQTVSFKVPASDCEIYLSARRKKDGRKIYFANKVTNKYRVLLGSITDVHLA